MNRRAAWRVPRPRPEDHRGYDVIQTWLEYKWKREVDPGRIRPHPWEFYLYFDI